jgi:hypothetical protein
VAARTPGNDEGARMDFGTIVVILLLGRAGEYEIMGGKIRLLRRREDP